MTDYEIKTLGEEPLVSMFYKDLEPEYKLSSTQLDLSDLGNLTKEVMPTLIRNFELYYAVREIGGKSQFDFFCMLQSCLNRNADTFERQLEVYDEDIAKPILGRTEKVTYDVHNNKHGVTNVNDHHIEVPADAPEYDTDRSRDKSDGETYDTNDQTGTVTTELSDLGVKPNYETLNGFLENNKSYIQFFIEKFEECFAPRITEIII